MPRLLRHIIFSGSPILLACLAGGQSMAPSGSGPTPKTTEQAFKNIQVLKGAPADQLIPTMQFVSASLGVECDFCHVPGSFEKDDKAPKQKAREMMQMMFAIDQRNFKGEREVTCYSCHRGSTRPVAAPPVAEAAAKLEIPAEKTGGEALPPNLPSPAQVVDKYIQAVGGAQAIQSVSSRVGKGTATVEGQPTAFELFAKAPNKRAAILHFSRGDSVTAFDGQNGWLGSAGRRTRDVGGAELEAMRVDADFYFPLHLTGTFKDLRMAKPEKIGDQEAYVLVGIPDAQPPVKLYFDEQSGLLLRMLRYSETLLGRLPTEIDYADYRDAGGAKTPYRWTLARASGRFTVQIDQLQVNVPVDDSRFAKPPEPPPDKP